MRCAEGPHPSGRRQVTPIEAARDTSIMSHGSIAECAGTVILSDDTHRTHCHSSLAAREKDDEAIHR
jgi:hypothetical protein